MIVRISKRSNPFVQIDKRPLEDDRLSWKAKGLWAYLLSKPNDWKIRTEDILNHGPDGRDAVRAAMSELRTFGFAKIEQTRDGKQWIVFEEPCGEKPSMAMDPCPEKAKMAKPATTNNKISVSNNNLFDLEEEPQKPKSRIKSPSQSALDSAELVYREYPRQVGKPVALKAIMKAIDLVGLPRLLELTAAYAKARGKDLQFVPHPATWFNQERYSDDPRTWLNGSTANGNGKHSPPPSDPSGWQEWLATKPDYARACHGKKYAATPEWIRREFALERKAATCLRR